MKDIVCAFLISNSTEALKIQITQVIQQMYEVMLSRILTELYYLLEHQLYYEET